MTLISTRHEARSALAIIRPIAMEVEDMLGRLNSQLRRADRFPDQVIELAASLADLRARLLDIAEANRDADYAAMQRQEPLL